METDLTGYKNKNRLQEDDLDTAEEELKNLKDRVHKLETDTEELERVNKQLRRSIDTLEGEFFCSFLNCCVVDFSVCLISVPTGLSSHSAKDEGDG